MKLHELKIKYEYLKEVQAGRKTFELRKNDRDYQVGDLIKFNCIDGDYQVGDLIKFNCIDGDRLIKVPAGYAMSNDCFLEEDTLYKITYILKDVPEYGLDSDYCILGIKKVILEEAK